MRVKKDAPLIEKVQRRCLIYTIKSTLSMNGKEKNNENYRDSLIASIINNRRVAFETILQYLIDNENLKPLFLLDSSNKSVFHYAILSNKNHFFKSLFSIKNIRLEEIKLDNLSLLMFCIRNNKIFCVKCLLDNIQNKDDYILQINFNKLNSLIYCILHDRSVCFTFLLSSLDNNNALNEDVSNKNLLFFCVVNGKPDYIKLLLKFKNKFQLKLIPKRMEYFHLIKYKCFELIRPLEGYKEFTVVNQIVDHDYENDIKYCEELCL